jgi:hypothetical protein
MQFLTRTCFPLRACAALALTLLLATTASSDVLPPAPVSVNLPFPAPNAFEVATAFGPNDGLLYVWTGNSVLKQNAIDSNSFTSLGGVGSGSADAGPIAFSRDASNLLVGNGSGGMLGGANAGQLFTIPAAGGSGASAGKVPFHFTLLASPLGVSNTQYFINQGDASFNSSSVTVFDSATASNVSVVANIPGASSSMAIDGGRLMVGIGFGPNRGDLRSFALADLQTAANSATPVDWSTGTLFNGIDNNGGAGMFFDARGFLFVGGPNGLTVFDTGGASIFYDNGGFSGIVYDPFGDRFLLTGWGLEQGIYPASMFFHVPEPSSVVLALMAGISLLGCIGRNRRRRVAARS